MGIIIAACVVEGGIYNFYSIFQPSNPVSFDLNATKTKVDTEITYVPLTEKEAENLEYQKKINQQLSELKGETYVEQEDPSLVTYEGKLSHKIYNSTMTVDLPSAEYVKKITLTYPVKSNMGYHVTLKRAGEEVDACYGTLYAKLGKDTVNTSGKADQVVLTLTTSSEFNAQGAVLTVSNPFYMNPYRVLFFVSIALLFAFLVLSKEWIVKKVEVVFVLFSLLLGTCIIAFVGTNQYSWDEHIHWERAYENSFLSTILTTESAMNMRGLLTPVYNTYEDKKEVATYTNAINDLTKADVGHKQRYVEYKYRAYLPQSVLLFAGRIAHLPFTLAFALGKFGNLLCYTLLMYLAIRISKIGKPMIAAIGLMPTPLFLASTYSYDAFVTGFLMIGFVLWLNEILEPDKPLKWYTALLMLACFIIGSWSKLPYILMALLLCFLPKNKFRSRIQEILFKLIVVVIAAMTLQLIVTAADIADGKLSKFLLVSVLLLFCILPKHYFKNRRQEISFKLLVIGITAVAVYLVLTLHAGSAFAAPISVADNIVHAGDKRTEGANMMQQLQFMIHNPLTYLGILLGSIAKFFYGYCFGTQPWLLYAYAGEFAKGFSVVTTFVLLGAALVQPKNERNASLSKSVKVLLGIMVFGLMSVIWTSMYVSFTAVGAKEIVGVQARYYIPFIFPLLLLLRNRTVKEKWASKISEGLYYRILFGTLLFLLAYGTYTFLLKPMCF